MKIAGFSLFTHLVSLCSLAIVSGARTQTGAAASEVESQPIDLGAFYGKVSGTEGDNWFTHEDWKIVPKGLQTFDGIIFDVSGTLLLRSKNMPQLKEAVRNIPVKQSCRYIHILHGVGYSDEDGTIIAVIEVHYTNGEKRDIPIVLGVHVRNWWKEKSEKTSEVFDLNSGVAWHGQGSYPPPERASVRLFRSTFVNPLLNETIDHIDFVSKDTKAIPCIVSLSVGDKKPVVKSGADAPSTPQTDVRK